MSETIGAYFCDTYKRKRGARYKGFSPKDGATLKRLVGIYGEKELRWIISHYLQIEDDPLIRNRGWDTGGLSMRARSLDLEYVKKYGEAEVEQANEKRAQLKAVKDPKVLALFGRFEGKR